MLLTRRHPLGFFIHPLSPSGVVCDMWKEDNLWCSHSHTNNQGSWVYYDASHIVSLEHTHLHLSSEAVNLYHLLPQGSAVTTDIKAFPPFSPYQQLQAGTFT